MSTLKGQPQRCGRNAKPGSPTVRKAAGSTSTGLLLCARSTMPEPASVRNQVRNRPVLALILSASRACTSTACSVRSASVAAPPRRKVYRFPEGGRLRWVEGRHRRHGDASGDVATRLFVHELQAVRGNLDVDRVGFVWVQGQRCGQGSLRRSADEKAVWADRIQDQRGIEPRNPGSGPSGCLDGRRSARRIQRSSSAAPRMTTTIGAVAAPATSNRENGPASEP